MADLGPVPWPPAPIGTDRLVLRESQAGDRAAFIELFASPDVHAYLGGPQLRAELERTVPEVPGRRRGCFVVDLGGAMIGFVTIERREPERPGRVRREGGEPEIGYLFLPQAWGFGYAAEACAAALDWFDATVPEEPVVLCTQTANVRSMRVAAKLGFVEVGRFEEYGAEQWFGVRSMELTVDTRRFLMTTPGPPPPRRHGGGRPAAPHAARSGRPGPRGRSGRRDGRGAAGRGPGPRR
jgi:RimJ/RimL family protein N-acetyltransferase